MIRPGVFRRATACAVLAALLATPLSAQYRHRVVLVEQSEADPASAEVVARVRGELTAAGFEVVLLPGSPNGDPAELSETTGRELHPAAAVLVLERPAEVGSPRTIELWLNDRLSRRTFVLRLPVSEEDASRGYQRVAVQAVELLKARLAELAFQREPEPSEPEPLPPPIVPPEPEPESEVEGRFGAGGGLVQGFSGVGASLAPLLKVGAGIPIGRSTMIDLGARVIAFGTGTTLRTEAGEARIEQSLGVAEGGIRLNPSSVLQPIVGVGIGAYRIDVEGISSGEGIGRSSGTWSLLTTLGIGMRIAPSRSVGIDFEGQLGRAWSKTTVMVEGSRVADLGSPLVLLTLAAVGTF